MGLPHVLGISGAAGVSRGAFQRRPAVRTRYLAARQPSTPAGADHPTRRRGSRRCNLGSLVAPIRANRDWYRSRSDRDQLVRRVCEPPPQGRDVWSARPAPGGDARKFSTPFKASGLAATAIPHVRRLARPKAASCGSRGHRCGSRRPLARRNDPADHRACHPHPRPARSAARGPSELSLALDGMGGPLLVGASMPRAGCAALKSHRWISSTRHAGTSLFCWSRSLTFGEQLLQLTFAEYLACHEVLLARRPALLRTGPRLTRKSYSGSPTQSHQRCTRARARALIIGAKRRLGSTHSAQPTRLIRAVSQRRSVTGGASPRATTTSSVCGQTRTRATEQADRQR